MFRTNKAKITALAVAVVAIVIALIGAFNKISTLETSKKLVNTDYSVGGISTSTGKILESKQSFYTKDLYSVDNMKIKVKEDTSISYKVFFYDEDKAFVSASSSLTEDFDATTIPETAKYFRVMVIPAEIDGEPAVCSGMNRAKYVSGLTITITK